MATVNEMQTRWLAQTLEGSTSQQVADLASAALGMGRQARDKWTRLNEQIAATQDPVDRTMLLVRKNAVSRTLADCSEVLRTIRDHQQHPKPVDIIATPEWQAAW